MKSILTKVLAAVLLLSTSACVKVTFDEGNGGTVTPPVDPTSNVITGVISSSKFYAKGKWILKISHWFLISCGDFSRMKPQAEEGITAIKWFSKEQFPIVYENTYASVTDLLKNYFN